MFARNRKMHVQRLLYALVATMLLLLTQCTRPVEEPEATPTERSETALPQATSTVTVTPTATPTLYPGAAIEGTPKSSMECGDYIFKFYYKYRWGQDTYCHPTEGFINFSVIELGVYEINGDASINRGGLTCQKQGDTLVCAPGSEPFTAAGSSFVPAGSLTTFRLVIQPK
jgi:hypothetical protein